MANAASASPPRELTNAEKVRLLPWALTGDAANVVYCYLTFAGPVFQLFLVKLGFDKPRIGLLLALFQFMGLLALVGGPLSARIGYRRVFLSLWTLRKLVMACMMLAPWLAMTRGTDVAYAAVLSIIAVFTVCRSVAESALLPWSQEYIPNTIRGKYTAVQRVIVTLSGTSTVALAGWWLGAAPESKDFVVLHAAALLMGLAGVLMYTKVPGGAPIRNPDRAMWSWRDLVEPWRDPAMRRFLFGAILITLGWTPMASFLPLFYREQVGLVDSQVVYLDGSVMIGSLCTAMLWGWAADRYGSKPVMVINVALMMLYPVGMMLLPRHHAGSFVASLALTFGVGMVVVGWNIGYYRYFFVNLVPPQSRAGYNAMHTATMGMIAGLCPIGAGMLLARTAEWRGQMGPFTIDPYLPLMISCMIVGTMGVLVLGGLPSTGAVPVRQFVSMFFQGNPVGAVQALIAYQWAGQETERVASVERLGSTRSPLSVEELMRSLADPSFNVRHEAIISIARTRRDSRLTAAMVKLLEEKQADLETTAAWALGRMGDRDAIPALRQALTSPHGLLRARAARALATLHDTDSIPDLRRMLGQEADPGLRVALASALSQLGDLESLASLLTLLEQVSEPWQQQELALAVATMLGTDAQALRLWRRMLEKPGDTLAGVMIGIRRWTTAQRGPWTATVLPAMDEAVRNLGAEAFEEARVNLRAILTGRDPHRFKPAANMVLDAVAAALAQPGVNRVEYLLLAVHALHVGRV